MLSCLDISIKHDIIPQCFPYWYYWKLKALGTNRTEPEAVFVGCLVVVRHLLTELGHPVNPMLRTGKEKSHQKAISTPLCFVRWTSAMWINTDLCTWGLGTTVSTPEQLFLCVKGDTGMLLQLCSYIDAISSTAVTWTLRHLASQQIKLYQGMVQFSWDLRLQDLLWSDGFCVHVHTPRLPPWRIS